MQGGGRSSFCPRCCLYHCSPLWLRMTSQWPFLQREPLAPSNRCRNPPGMHAQEGMPEAVSRTWSLRVQVALVTWVPSPTLSFHLGILPAPSYFCPAECSSSEASKDGVCGECLESLSGTMAGGAGQGGWRPGCARGSAYPQKWGRGVLIRFPIEQAWKCKIRS